MNLFKRHIGQKGEDIAVTYLQNLGYRILERNFRSRFGEIDIICQVNDVLVFVEVKTKSNDTFGSPEDMFNYRKQNQVKQMTQIYLKYKAPYQTSYRIDLIAINLETNTSPEIHHYQSIY